MSKYTTQLRFICEHFAGESESKGFDNVEEIIENSMEYIMPIYPIFDEYYRSELNRKIIMHFYTREIGSETFGLWKLRLTAKMNEIMPYYNQLYKSELLEFNPLYDVDVMTERKIKNNGQSVNNKNSKNFDSNTSERNGNDNESREGKNMSKNKRDNTTITDNSNRTSGTTVGKSKTVHDETKLYSDTPQGGLGNFELDNLFLTNATKNNMGEKVDNSNSTVGESNNKTNVGEKENSNSNSNFSELNSRNFEEKIKNDNKRNENTKMSSVASNFEEYSERVFGKRSGNNTSVLLSDFRKTFLNIDMQIIAELEPLFFGLWE